MSRGVWRDPWSGGSLVKAFAEIGLYCVTLLSVCLVISYRAR